MSVFTSSPLSYVQGELIVATIIANNEIGPSDPSTANTSGLDAQVKPWKPASTPDKISSTTTSVTIEMPEVTDDYTGGSLITSYNLQWSTGLNEPFISVTGESPVQISRTYTQT
jgi:hypothetical protein